MSEGIQFPVPTLTAALPNRVAPTFGTLAKRSDLYRIAEDEWRQTEFLSLDWQSTIERELSLVRTIRSHAPEPGAFLRMHLRNIKGLWGVSLEQMARILCLPDDSWRRLAFEGGVGIVSNSFAVPFGDCLIYGQQQKGITESLCLQRGYFPGVTQGTLLCDFASTHNCALIDWCEGTLMTPFIDNFERYFSTE